MPVYSINYSYHLSIQMDKRNLTRKIAEQDEVMKLLIGPKSFQELIQSPLIDEVLHDFCKERKCKSREMEPS